MNKRLIFFVLILIALWFFAGRPPWGSWSAEQAVLGGKIADLDIRLSEENKKRMRVFALRKWIKKLEKGLADRKENKPMSRRADDRLQALQDAALARGLVLLKAQGPSDTASSGPSERLTVEGGFGQVLSFLNTAPESFDDNALRQARLERVGDKVRFSFTFQKSKEEELEKEKKFSYEEAILRAKEKMRIGAATEFFSKNKKIKRKRILEDPFHPAWEKKKDAKKEEVKGLALEEVPWTPAPVQLVGVILGEKNIALLRSLRDKKKTWVVSVGEEVAGLRVTRIKRKEIEGAFQGRQMRLYLPASLRSSKAKP